MALERSSPKETIPTIKKLEEAVIATAYGGVRGAAFGGMGGMIIFAPLARRYPTSPSISESDAACLAAWSGIESIMKGIRGKHDLTSELVSASGAGLALSFVSIGLKVNPTHALSYAAGFAALSGTIYKVSETNRTRNSQNAFYRDLRAMLSNLGLEEYKKNFKKGHLTDSTLPLLTDSDLRELNIPPGPRRLILDHIKSYNKMVNRK